MVVLRPDLVRDLLLTCVHVRHGSGRCAGWKLGFPDDGTCGLVVGAKFFTSATGRRTNVDRISFADKEQRLRHEWRRAAGLTKWRQVQMLDCGMVTRSVAVRFHPYVITCIKVDRCDPAIWRFVK